MKKPQIRERVFVEPAALKPRNIMKEAQRVAVVNVT